MAAAIRKHAFFIDLLIITLLASFLYFWGLAQNPPSLNWDEASLGYNAYSILQTGHDEWGKVFPISFQAFGEYKLPGYIYTSVPFIAVFGLNELGTRAASAFFGVLTVVLTYLIVYRITQKRYAAFFSGLLVAVAPWHFFVSRIALEANLALFFIALGVYLFLEGVMHKSWLLLPSIVSFLFAVFTYNSARVFVPLFLMVLIIIYWKRLWELKRISIISFLFFFSIFMLSIPVSLKEGSARYVSVTLLDQGGINRINEMRGSSALPGQYKKIVYNKVTYFVSETAKNYMVYFSPEFLFVKGGTQYQFSLPNYGLLYVIDLPLFLVGTFMVLMKRQRLGFVLLAWILLAPLPAAITRETPHVLRSLFMFLPIELVVGIGFFETIRNLLLRQRALAYGFTILLVTAVMLQAGKYYQTYAYSYPVQYSCSWQYGEKEVVQYITAHQQDYDRIVMTKRYGEPHIFLLFFQAYNPTTYNNDSHLARYMQSNHAWVDRFNKYEFVNDWELQAHVKQLVDQNVGKILIVTSGKNYPRILQPLTTINFLNNDLAFSLLSIDSNKAKISSGDITVQQPLRGCFND